MPMIVQNMYQRRKWLQKDTQDIIVGLSVRTARRDGGTTSGHIGPAQLREWNLLAIQLPCFRYLSDGTSWHKWKPIFNGDEDVPWT